MNGDDVVMTTVKRGHDNGDDGCMKTTAECLFSYPVVAAELILITFSRVAFHPAPSAVDSVR